MRIVRVLVPHPRSFFFRLPFSRQCAFSLHFHFTFLFDFCCIENSTLNGSLEASTNAIVSSSLLLLLIFHVMCFFFCMCQHSSSFRVGPFIFRSMQKILHWMQLYGLTVANFRFFFCALTPLVFQLALIHILISTNIFLFFCPLYSLCLIVHVRTSYYSFCS